MGQMFITNVVVVCCMRRLQMLQRLNNNVATCSLDNICNHCLQQIKTTFATKFSISNTCPVSLEKHLTWWHAIASVSVTHGWARNMRHVQLAIFFLRVALAYSRKNKSSPTTLSRVVGYPIRQLLHEGTEIFCIDRALSITWLHFRARSFDCTRSIFQLQQTRHKQRFSGPKVSVLPAFPHLETRTRHRTAGRAQVAATSSVTGSLYARPNESVSA